MASSLYLLGPGNRIHALVRPILRPHLERSADLTRGFRARLPYIFLTIATYDFGYVSSFTVVCDSRIGGMDLGCPGFAFDILVSSSVPRLLAIRLTFS